MIRTAAICILAASTLLACTTPGNQGMRAITETECSQNACNLDVNVAVDSSVNPPNVVISVDFYNLRIKKGNLGAGNNGVMIHWHLRNNDFEFKDDSIQFKDPAYTSQFDDKQVTSGAGSQFKWRDKNGFPRQWSYQIKVYERRTGAWTAMDPTIINDGP